MLSEEPGEQDALGNVLNHWAEESGNTIKKIIISHDDMRSKFPAMAKNKDLPDIVSTTFLHQIYPDEFVNMEDVVDLSKFNQSALNIVGKSYSSDAITGITEQFTTTCVIRMLLLQQALKLLHRKIHGPGSSCMRMPQCFRKRAA